MASTHDQSDATPIGQLLDWGTRLLASTSASPRLDAEVLMADLVSWPRSTVMAFPGRTLPQGMTDEFRGLIRRRGEGTPLAHLTGRREFYSLDLRVSADTLVPRPESELLVDQLLERVTLIEAVSILDLGTGSGAIALAIKRQRPDARVVAVDWSAAALSVAIDNGNRLKIQVEWLLSDWFEALDGRLFDFIVANPPYVGRGDPRLVSGDLRHEPRIALDGGVDGLDSIREIIAGAPRVLVPGGTLLLEHGYDQAPAVARLFRALGFRRIETHKDLAGQDRTTVGTVP